MGLKRYRFYLLIIAQVSFINLVHFSSGYNYEERSDICSRIYHCSECPFTRITSAVLKTVEDFEKCAPALLDQPVREYILAASGRRLTYEANLNSFRDIRLIPRILRDVSNIDMSTTLLGESISAPIGLAPVAAMELVNTEGEAGAARAAAMEDVVMILSVSATQSIEQVARSIRGLVTVEGRRKPVLWIQTYIYRNRSNILQVIRRAEKAGFKAIVVTVDTPILADNICGQKEILKNISSPNMPYKDSPDTSITFNDLLWVKKNTYLPIVAKGVLSVNDALQAVRAGVSAVYVSNHGGRQLDGAVTPMDVLPEIAKVLKICCPNVEVYFDGGVRNGFDVFKALAAGARAVFIGRPTVWGLTVAGGKGVRKVLSILKEELNQTMILSGASSLSEITSDLIFQPYRVDSFTRSL